MTIQDIFAHTTALKSKIENLSIEALKAEQASNSDLLLIDIREIQERIDLGTIPTAVHCARQVLLLWNNECGQWRADQRAVQACAVKIPDLRGQRLYEDVLVCHRQLQYRRLLARGVVGRIIRRKKAGQRRVRWTK